MLGKPCIRGTLITVELLLEKMGYGVTIDELLLEYPHITREQILAGMRFAASELRAHALSA
ncbi:hypothetical protein AYO38_00150 [bacterium SCGC AG-212-C10]|nr:hypothetical protein AYO38_00150 [bacterium SCGC AG-212-C10]